MSRECGGCTLCCKLVPVRELGKPALQRCKFQVTGKGCRVHQQPEKGFPRSCWLWNCGWLMGAPGTEKMSRPDRAHYVIDPMADFVRQDGEPVPVMQVWIDPKYPDAHRDPALRALIELHDAATLVRYGNDAALMIWPPRRCSDGQWHEMAPNELQREHTHSAAEIIAVLDAHA